jgi:hypothetical protein
MQMYGEQGKCLSICHKQNSSIHAFVDLLREDEENSPRMRAILLDMIGEIIHKRTILNPDCDGNPG